MLPREKWKNKWIILKLKIQLLTAVYIKSLLYQKLGFQFLRKYRKVKNELQLFTDLEE